MMRVIFFRRSEIAFFLHELKSKIFLRGFFAHSSEIFYHELASDKKFHENVQKKLEKKFLTSMSTGKMRFRCGEQK